MDAQPYLYRKAIWPGPKPRFILQYQRLMAYQQRRGCALTLSQPATGHAGLLSLRAIVPITATAANLPP
jgi:hypothetical protein